MHVHTAKKLLAFSEKEYDTYAREFSDTRPFFWRELEFLKKYGRLEHTILDIGCGNGRLIDLFGNKNIRYTGVDSSKELIEIAKKHRGKQGKFIHANALSLPFKDNTFDTVFSIAVLHHVPSKNFRTRFVQEAYRVTKPRGTLILTVWNIWQWRFWKDHAVHILKKLIGLSDLDFGDTILTFGQQKKKRYVHAFTKRGLTTLLEKNGFTVSSIEEKRRQSGYANLVVIARKK
jgi:SAM-dependent methyltransferase